MLPDSFQLIALMTFASELPSTNDIPGLAIPKRLVPEPPLMYSQYQKPLVSDTVQRVVATTPSLVLWVMTRLPTEKVLFALVAAGLNVCVVIYNPMVTTVSSPMPVAM